jgi:ribokinase
MKKIIGTGSLIVDIAGYATRLPVAGETTLGQTLRLGPGGKGNNQMTAAHRAGAETIIIGKIGTDFLSQLMLRHYADEGMSTRYIKTTDKNVTGSALIEIDTQTAQNRIIVVKGACDEVTAEEVLEAEADFAGCDLVLTQLETSLESVRECKRLAAKYHKPFILNPAPFQKIPEELFAGIDYITPNETEAEYFTGITVNTEFDAEKAAAKFISIGVKNVLITLGKNGVFYSNGTRCLSVPGIVVDSVDTTGAGDAFNGGFATAIAEGYDLETSLKFANCVGALSTTRRGSATAMPRRSEIIQFLHQNYRINLSKS